VADLAELSSETGGEMGVLERIAAQSLARRLDGRLTLAPRPEGGCTLAVTWDGPS
jgi:hypothetical protein